MNPFYNIVPPSMDVICTTSFQGNYSLTTPLQLLSSTSTSTCSTPLDYYKAYAFDLSFIALAIIVVMQIFKRRN